MPPSAYTKATVFAGPIVLIECTRTVFASGSLVNAVSQKTLSAAVFGENGVADQQVGNIPTIQAASTKDFLEIKLFDYGPDINEPFDSIRISMGSTLRIDISFPF